jgi:hypothetical protein
MSAKPAVLEAALAPFLAAGMRVTVQGAYLLLHNVPVVTAQRTLRLGTLIATFIHSDTQVSPPTTHQAWFDGPFPCFADGTAIEQMRYSDVAGGTLVEGVPAKYFFSNKDDGWTGYTTHFDLMMHYWRLITDQARVIDPSCIQVLGGGSAEIVPAGGPFRYTDACSARGNFLKASERLAGINIAIVGLGGTGSYVLDQVAKTPVREIHIFDGDVFELHNNFRAPGAASEAEFGQPKVTYFANMFAPLRTGIVEHMAYVREANIGLLEQFDFVFVCIDKGPDRRLICSRLIEFGIPFIDCGMDLSQSEGHQIYGSCRATMATAGKNDHFFSRVPTMEDAGDALYEQNIQLGDINALNAMLAVVRWKQHFGFYGMNWDWHHLELSINAMGLAKAITSEKN